MSPRSLVAFEIVVALTAAQRVLELWYSRANLRKQSSASRPADSAGNWRALVFLQSAWLIGTSAEALLAKDVAPPVFFWTGLTLFLAGEALRVWCIRALGSAWNARASVDPGLRVVSTGPYRWVRHPNYLGVLLELVGLSLAGGAWLTLAALLPLHLIVLTRRMRGEDALLFSLPGYARAMSGKGALLPRLGPSSSRR